VAGVVKECASKAEQPSWSVREIFDTLVDLEMFPILDIPLQPRSAQDLLTAVGLILGHLREEHAFGVDPPV
jgi:hypothetical protein